ncbi:MAG: hypothetical protein ABL893_20890, partial [Hyphomicrobium sp.]
KAPYVKPDFAKPDYAKPAHTKPDHPKPAWKARDKDAAGAPAYRDRAAGGAKPHAPFKKPHYSKDGGKAPFKGGDASAARPGGNFSDKKFGAKKKHRKGPAAPA